MRVRYSYIVYAHFFRITNINLIRFAISRTLILSSHSEEIYEYTNMMTLQTTK